MAANFIYGPDGAIYIGTAGSPQLVSFMSGWTMNIGTGVADTPDLGSSGPKRVYTKYKDFSGSVNGQYRYIVPTTAATVTDTEPEQERISRMFSKGGTPAVAQALFIESSQSMWFGNVAFTNVTKNQPTEGLQTWSADWAQSGGPLAHSTNTST